MSERLNREAVERQIREMWDALIDQQVGISPAEYVDLDQAKEQARQCEERLRGRLDAQDRLDAAAPDLLAACKMLAGVYAWAERHHKRSILDCCQWSVVHEAIAKAEGTHEKQDS